MYWGEEGRERGEKQKICSVQFVVSCIVSLLLVVPAKLPTYQAQKDPKEVN